MEVNGSQMEDVCACVRMSVSECECEWVCWNTPNISGAFWGLKNIRTENPSAKVHFRFPRGACHLRQACITQHNTRARPVVFFPDSLNNFTYTRICKFIKLTKVPGFKRVITIELHQINQSIRYVKLKEPFKCAELIILG